MIDRLGSRLRSVARRLLWRSTPQSLDSVEIAPTIGDVVDRHEIGRRLPEGWRVERDIVQFRGDSLAEVLRLIDRRDGFRITLKPVDILEPTAAVELYTLASPFDARQRRETADSLAEALDSAAEIAATRRRTRRSADRSGWGSPTDGSPGP